MDILECVILTNNLCWQSVYYSLLELPGLFILKQIWLLTSFRHSSSLPFVGSLEVRPLLQAKLISIHNCFLNINPSEWCCQIDKIHKYTLISTKLFTLIRCFNVYFIYLNTSLWWINIHIKTRMNMKLAWSKAATRVIQ